MGQIKITKQKMKITKTENGKVKQKKYESRKWDK